MPYPLFPVVERPCGVGGRVDDVAYYVYVQNRTETVTLAGGVVKLKPGVVPEGFGSQYSKASWSVPKFGMSSRVYSPTFTNSILQQLENAPIFGYGPSAL